MTPDLVDIAFVTLIIATSFAKTASNERQRADEALRLAQATLVEAEEIAARTARHADKIDAAFDICVRDLKEVVSLIKIGAVDEAHQHLAEISGGQNV